ncbi:histone-lysine N-methyltransferase 2B-like [Mustela erminea]|uniref:histone-lysine N-methyltransferase 2B-like n=1 Tax=Mustela erminea TaxID=36723 RepID=UPI001386C517|nr:histone-lysine N-methyltransferase 2B-like [Mustela erminea]
MEPAAVCAHTGASGRWRGELSRPPLGLSTLTSALKPLLQPSLGNRQPELREEEPKERARRGKERRGGGVRGSDPSPHHAFLLPELFWWEPLLSSPPPLPLGSLPSSGSSSSHFSGAGDGQRARTARQLRIHSPPSPQLAAPPPPLSPPRCPQAPVPRLRQRRRRSTALPAACAAQPSRAPGWRFPPRTGLECNNSRIL